MARYSREEIDEAFKAYQAAGLKTARSGDWNYWGDLFTEDCTYIEHQVGQWGGREAVVREMSALMHQTEGTPWVWCNQYPVKDYVIDEDRGWVWSQIWNRMEDPGDGEVYQTNCLTMLRYAGGGLFSYEEDLYNPLAFEKMLGEWVASNEALKKEGRETVREARASVAHEFAELDAGDPKPPSNFYDRYAEQRRQRANVGRFPVEEIAEAFDHYCAQLALAGKTRDWRHWGAALTKDVTLIDCTLGHLGKREAVVREVEGKLHRVDESAPWVMLSRFPSDEYVIDEASRKVWSFFWARFSDPGDGTRHEARVFAELEYAGEGLFKQIETLYNPHHLKRALESYVDAKKRYDERRERRAKRLAERERKARELAPLKLDAEGREVS